LCFDACLAHFDYCGALAEKGQSGTFDTSRPITVIPTWLSGPEPSDKDLGEDKSIEIRPSIAGTQMQACVSRAV
jgi:hypothetical protein